MSPCPPLVAAFAVQARDTQADKPPRLTTELQAMAKVMQIEYAQEK
jgi:hypothetical protein